MGQQSYGASCNARAEDFINLEAFPLDGRDPAGYRDVLADARAQLNEDAAVFFVALCGTQ